MIRVCQIDQHRLAQHETDILHRDILVEHLLTIELQADNPRALGASRGRGLLLKRGEEAQPFLILRDQRG